MHRDAVKLRQDEETFLQKGAEPQHLSATLNLPQTRRRQQFLHEQFQNHIPFAHVV